MMWATLQVDTHRDLMSWLKTHWTKYTRIFMFEFTYKSYLGFVEFEISKFAIIKMAKF